MSHPTDYTFVPQSEIKRLALEAYHAVHMDDQIAEYAAHALWLTTLRGVDSHGIRLLPYYISVTEGGRINPKPKVTFEKTAAATGILDADHTIGHAASMIAMHHAIELANDAGVGIVLVKNSTHNGSQASYGLEAAHKDMIGMAMTSATPYVRTPNSTRPFFGTNPICITAPMLNEDPFCYDAAPTPFTGNKVAQYREDGKTLPEGIAADINGQPITDPQQVFQLLPIGDYKGFGLLFMVDMLTGMLTGMPSGDEITHMFTEDVSSKRYQAHFCMAIRISAFRDVSEFKQVLQTQAEKIRNLPRLDQNVPVYVPGDPEKINAKQRQEHGIPVKPYDMEQLGQLANHLNIKPLQALTD